MSLNTRVVLLPRQAFSTTAGTSTASVTPKAVPLSGDSCRHRSSWDGCRSNRATSSRCVSFGPCLSQPHRCSATPSNRFAPRSGRGMRIDTGTPAAARISDSCFHSVAGAVADAVTSAAAACAAAWQFRLTAYRKCANVASDAHAGILDMWRAVAPVFWSAPRWAVTCCILSLLIAQVLFIGAFTATATGCEEVSATPGMVNRVRLGVLCLLVFLAGAILACFQDHPLRSLVSTLV